MGNETGQKIHLLRKEKGWTLERLANAVGVTKSTVRKWETGDIKNMGGDKIAALAQALDTTTFYLMDWKERPEKENQMVPLLGAVSYGEPIYANREYTCIDGPIKADFCLRATDNSMSGISIKDGSIVFCHRQEMVEDGEIAAVLIGDEVTLKRFYYYKENDLVILRSENPDYKDQVYAGYKINQIKVLGKVIAFQTLIE